MNVTLAFDSERQGALGDAICRLQVLYPQFVFEIRDGFVDIGNVPADKLDDVRQTASDQLVRSRYAEDTNGLREKLYVRLLG